MNIFIVDQSPRECARSLDDKRLNKMTIETAQILSTAAHLHGIQCTYKPTHKGHPCVQWAAASSANYTWLLELFQELGSEWEFRYGKIHGCLRVKNELMAAVSAIPVGQITKNANCSMFKQATDIIQAYRATMVYKWRKLDKNPRWTKRQPPSWYNSYIVLVDNLEAPNDREDSEKVR